MKYIWISKTSLVPIGLYSTEKTFTLPRHPFFSCYKSLNLLKYYLNIVYIVVFLNLLLRIDIFFVELTNKKLLLPL